MILIINGSPNKESKTMSVVKELLQQSNEKQIVINSYQQTIISCDDCKYCDHQIGCSKSDDMDHIHELLEQATTLIIASPIYFGGLSDQTMKIINRFQRYYSQKWVLKDLNIPQFDNLILVSTQGSDKLRMFNGAIETMNILDKLFTPKYTNNIMIPESDSTPLLTPIQLEQIKETYKKMIQN